MFFKNFNTRYIKISYKLKKYLRRKTLRYILTPDHESQSNHKGSNYSHCAQYHARYYIDKGRQKTAVRSLVQER